MPYIKTVARNHYDDCLDDVPVALTPGDLNYCISRLVLKYLRSRGLNYGTVNDIMGALTGVQNEFYRRVAAPYEDQKIVENGDL